jgi:hypothetical protein
VQRTATLRSLCRQQPKVNATSDVGKMNHRMAAWNDSPPRMLALRTGRKINKTGVARQWIIHRPGEHRREIRHPLQVGDFEGLTRLRRLRRVHHSFSREVQEPPARRRCSFEIDFFTLMSASIWLVCYKVTFVML